MKGDNSRSICAWEGVKGKTDSRGINALDVVKGDNSRGISALDVVKGDNSRGISA